MSKSVAKTETKTAPSLLNTRSRQSLSSALSSSSLFTFDFAKRTKKAKATTDVKVKGEKDVCNSKSEEKSKSTYQKENKRSNLVPVKRKLNFEDDDEDKEENEDDDEDWQKVEVKKREKGLPTPKKNKIVQELSPARHLRPRQVEDSPVKGKNVMKPSKNSGTTQKSSKSTEIHSKSTEINSKSSKSTTISSITPKLRTSIKPKQLELEITSKQSKNDNSAAKFDALKKVKESETSPNYRIIQIRSQQNKEKETVAKPTPTPKATPASSSGASDNDTPLEFIVDPDLEDYFSMENTRETGNVLLMKKSDLASTIAFVSPGDLEFKQLLPGVAMGSILTEGPALGPQGPVTGILKIEPRTVKPMEKTLTNSRLIYWIQEGEVTVKSTSHANSGGRNVLYGKSLGVGSCILVPPATPYMLINRSDQVIAKLAFVLLSS